MKNKIELYKYVVIIVFILGAVCAGKIIYDYIDILEKNASILEIILETEDKTKK